MHQSRGDGLAGSRASGISLWPNWKMHDTDLNKVVLCNNSFLFLVWHVIKLRGREGCGGGVRGVGGRRGECICNRCHQSSTGTRASVFSLSFLPLAQSLKSARETWFQIRHTSGPVHSLGCFTLHWCNSETISSRFFIGNFNDGCGVFHKGLEYMTF